MRLTLRTLLAWRDGLLSEADQAELGAKIAASAVAPQLLERIAEVAARPGLPAPRIDGRGLAEDPNSAAEFLDNALPGERLEAFERICIDSDIHLGEATDCHALLAELARDPAALPVIDAQAKARLLATVAGQIEKPVAQPRHEESAALAKAIQQATGRPLAAAPAKPASPWAWLSAAAAVVLLVTLGGLLLRTLWSPTKPGRQVAAVKQPGPPPPRKPALPPAAEPFAAAPADIPAEPPAQPPVEPPPQAVIIDPAVEPPAVAAIPPEPQPPQPAIVPLPVMERDDAPAFPEPAAAMPAAPAKPPAGKPTGPGIVVAGGPLLKRAADGWQALMVGMPLDDDEELLVPSHSYPRLERGEVVIRLFPDTQAAILADPDGTPRVEVIFGRAVVWTEAAGSLVGITAGGLSGTLTLGPRQPVGIAVDLDREPGSDPAVIPPLRRATLFASGGGRWRQTEPDGGPPGAPLGGIALEQPLPPSGGLAWESTAAIAARVVPPAAEPAWMRQSEPTGPIDRSAAAALARALAAPESPLEAVQALAVDRRVENRMAAAATLALVGDYGPLVTLLCEEAPGARLAENQWRSLVDRTVPLALARGAKAAAALRQAFAARGPAGREHDLFRLARGFAPAELAAGGAAELVDWLEDPALVVRRFAFAALDALAADRPPAGRDYRPDRPPRLNDKGLAWWRNWLAANRGDTGPNPAAGPTVNPAADAGEP
jgi:hypothetical protein